MIENLLQEITIYHKKNNEWIRYNVKASVRNTSYLNRNRTGLSNADNTLIRIFDNETFECKQGDVIVLKNINDEIIKAPLTELKTKYGKENVIEVSSSEPFIFKSPDLEEINHTKIGGR